MIEDLSSSGFDVIAEMYLIQIIQQHGKIICWTLYTIEYGDEHFHVQCDFPAGSQGEGEVVFFCN